MKVIMLSKKLLAVLILLPAMLSLPLCLQGQIKLAEKEELNKVNSQLQLMKDEVERGIFGEWQSALSSAFPEYEPLPAGSHAGVIMPAGETAVRVFSYIDSGKLCCQVDRGGIPDTDGGAPDDVMEKVNHILVLRNKTGQIWKYFPRYSYDDTYKCMIDVINILKTFNK